MNLLLWAALAAAAPLNDATALYRYGDLSCVQRDGKEDACWGLEADRATPVSELSTRPKRPERRCELRGEQVWCTGTNIALWTGLPPETPEDAWFEVPQLEGATDLGSPGCALIREQLYCLDNGELELRTPHRWARLVNGSCGLTEAGAVTCRSREQLPEATGIRAIQVKRGRALWRDEAGQVWSWNSREKPVAINIPPLQGGDDTLLLGAHHRCALAPGGEVWCWGADAHNELGDGGGPTLAWVDEYPSSYTPRHLMCTAPCSAQEVWGSPTLPDVPALRDVRAGPHVACGLDEEGWVRCYGTIGDALVLPEPIVDKVLDYDTYYGAALLQRDGTVVRFVEPNRFEPVFTLPGATHVVQTSRTACAFSSTQVRCHNHEFVFDPPHPGVPLENRSGAICQVGRPLCLEGAIMLEDGPGTTPHRVETSW